jgi:ABC-2 type transport system ATP-binding protein
MKNIIKIENLTKKYGNLTALDNFSLEVREGEILGLLGPNGSGKTTAINCILSLLEFQEGKITIFDKEMTPDAYDIKRNIGVVMQNVAVFNELTVYENIDYFCGLYITDKEKRKNMVEEAINLVGLQDFKKFYPKKLSGGLLRRLNIACGIAHKPKIIFLDEPTVAVDPQSRNNILEGIKILNKQGATIIYTTHYMEEVEQLCNRIVIMDKGNIIAVGSKEKLKTMIDLGEKITVEISNLTKKHVEGISSLPNVKSIVVDDDIVCINFSDNHHNLINVLDYIKDNNLNCIRVYSELPTLNDVFLEITGKQLRD